MDSKRRARTITFSPVAEKEGCDEPSEEQQELSPISRALTAPASVRRGPSEGRHVVLNKKVLAELFNGMREAADADSVPKPPHSRLLPFSHLRVRTLGGLHKLRTASAERFRQPPIHKYFGVAFQLAVLVLNFSLLVRSLHQMVSFLAGLASMDEQVFAGHIQVGFLSAADRQHLVSIFEGVGLLWYMVRLALTVGQAQSNAEEGLEGLRRWSAHANLYWELLPALRTFSAMRMLRRVHPQLLPMELGALVKTLQRERAPGHKKLLVFLNFFGQRILILYFGFQAFVFKFTFTAMRLQATSGNPMRQLFISFAFLNQLLGGVIQLEKLMRNRLVLFLFGGEDAHIDAEEAALMHVWTACLARTLHREVTASKGGPWPRLRSLVVMCCFNHMDLQQIVLIEDYEQVTQRHALIRQFSRGLADRTLAQEGEIDLEEPSLQDLLDTGVDPALPNAHVLLRGD